MRTEPTNTDTLALYRSSANAILGTARRLLAAPAPAADRAVMIATLRDMTALAPPEARAEAVAMSLYATRLEAIA